MAKVLVVDDSPGMRALAATILRYAGHEAQTAADGEQAMQVLERQRLDLILLDLTMPRMDGLELLERLCRMGQGRPPMPVVIFSSRDDIQTRARATELGACGFVTKNTATPQELWAVVESHVDQPGD